ncbi:beta-N-acetylglucosaminidase domain-containing protein [Streptococcus pacificus]|uniref:Beta-N-acetylglucosaminidase domain-containing protein n=1 Tax=Streptococcus pacificus TaxID=2740577 RepID=A0ABS0ZH29_9STRE|nr:beta-N-acetylglucosaminidase domain-containing protein [Streptococcus pacificus]MBJ8325313.1 beta-N-acetylglucosaminidase domain-containing protein [Streptococcus pacificus]
MAFNRQYKGERSFHYSIRKTSIGVGSVVVGMLLFGTSPLTVLAEENQDNMVMTNEVVGDQERTVETGIAADSESSNDTTNSTEVASHQGVTVTEEIDSADTEIPMLSTALEDGANPKELVSSDKEVAPDGTIALDNQYTATPDFSKEAVDAAVTDQAYLEKEYVIYPTPQKITYGDGLLRLDQTVNLVVGQDVDIYTSNRAKEILQANQISYTTSSEVATTTPNILLGIRGKDTLASQHQASSQIDSALFDKIDAYSIVIKDNTISVLGKDTDAVFYGLTSLKHMLKDSDVPVLRELVVEDYADIKNRSFIEGYYGNPWSNEDRAELMRYGGDLKMTQYVFAPKDDPYHNSKWRELYPDDKLEEIKMLARVGNQSKTRYVWTIHPFMSNPVRFDKDGQGNYRFYEDDLKIIKAKFTQLLNVGVREFGILADDAATPVGGAASYNKLMTDLTQWLTEKQAEYTGLRKEMIFVPHEYWGNGTEAELRSLNNGLPETSSLTLTGGRIWGQVTNQFLNNLKTNLSANGATYRPVQLWINWPTTDNSKQHLILGGGEQFLQPNVDPSLIAGIMLNPMQQSEPSKIALFSAAEYTWKIWKSVAQAKSVNDMAFNFAENGTFKPSETANAFRELGKHMINQNMDTRVVKLEESVELAPKLTRFITKLKAGEDISAERDELRQEFTKLKTAAETYKANGYSRMKDQIIYWLDNTIDQMNALDKLLTATEYIKTDNTTGLWENYKAGLDFYNTSKTHRFWYVSGYQNAELGVQHIRPFILTLLDELSKEVENSLDPSQVQQSFITNRAIASGDLNSILDGDLSTKILSTTPNSIAVGDYVGLEFSKAQVIKNLIFAMGTKENLRDTFSRAKVEYLNETDEWLTIEKEGLVGNEQLIEFDNLAINAKAVRLIATAAKGNTWLGVREIAVNRPLEASKNNADLELTVTHSNNLIYKIGRNQNYILDNDPNTEAMLANANNQDNTPQGAWVQVSVEKPTEITKVTITQGQGDKIARGVIEYSDDLVTWHKLRDVNGERKIEINTGIVAKAIRITNHQAMSKWWRISQFMLESHSGTLEYTDTNVESLKNSKTYVEDNQYKLILEGQHQLAAGDYVGLRLERLHELQDIALETPAGETINTPLSLLYSPNNVEWFSKEQITDHNLVRYLRLVNQTNDTQSLEDYHLILETVEVLPNSLESTTMGINSYYGANDVRNINNLSDLFDGKLDRHVEFSDFQRRDGEVVIKLGTTRNIKKIRGYIQDGTQNYLRDGKIQVSTDGTNWVDVVTIGDGITNPTRDSSLDDGWTHDSENPGNRFIEGTLASPVEANYLRILFTADYLQRFMAFTELVINDGEFVKTVNDPTVETKNSETSQSLANNIVDGKILTTYHLDKEAGKLIYHLSEETNHNHITILSTASSKAPIMVRARVAESSKDYDQNVASHWITLGNLQSSFAKVILPSSVKHLLDLELSWDNHPIDIYEVKTYYDTVKKEQIVKNGKGVFVEDLPEFTGVLEEKVPDNFPVNELPESDFVPDTKVPETAPSYELPESDFVPETKVPDNYPSYELPDSDFVPETKIPDTYPNYDLPEMPVPLESQVPKTAPTVEELPSIVFETGKATTHQLEELTFLQDSKEIVDAKTGVRIQLEKGELALITGAKVNHKETLDKETPQVLKGLDYDLYDIELLDDAGQVISPLKDSLVILPIDEGKEVGEVIYLPNSNEAERLAFTSTTYTDEKGQNHTGIVFVAKHFSEYGIVYKTLQHKNESTAKDNQKEKVLLMTDSPSNTSKEIFAKGNSKNSNELPKTGDTNTLSVLGSLSLLSALSLYGYGQKKKEFD